MCQARLKGGTFSMASIGGGFKGPKFRSPLVPQQNGSVSYRFEDDRQRAQTPRQLVETKLAEKNGVHAKPFLLPSGSIPPRPLYTVTTTPRLTTPRGRDDLRTSRASGGPPGTSAASANPPAVARVFRELDRLTMQNLRLGASPRTPEATVTRPHSARVVGLPLTAHSSELPREGEATFEPRPATGAPAVAVRAPDVRGWDALEAQARCGGLGQEAPLTLEVVYCIDSSQHKDTSGQPDPQRYRDCCAALRRAVDVQLAGWRVAVSEQAYDWAQRGAGRGAIQLGAFEVWLVWDSEGKRHSMLVHSKQRTRQLPDADSLVRRLRESIAAGSATE
jgi:hypothetical protein